MDGAGAPALWTAIEPVLREGVDPELLLAALPAEGRDLAAVILARLAEQHLLREVEVGMSAPGVPALAHLETIARRPVAAARLVAATTLRVVGNGPAARSAVAHLAAAGYAEVLPESREEPALLARVERQEADGRWSPVAFAVGDARTVLVGPRNRDGEPALERAALLALARHGDPGAVADGGPGTLVGAQLALAVLASSARAEEVPPVGRVEPAWPEYLVTTGGLETETRTLVGLGRLTLEGPSVRLDAWTWGDGHDEQSDPAALDRLEPVWDPVLGVVGRPLPLDLPQLPVGLAAIVDDEGRTRGGIGTTTAAARLDALLTALRSVAAAPSGALGLGTSPEAARAEALARLVARSGLRWQAVRPDPDRIGADARLLHAALVLHLPEPPIVAHAETATGLHRVDVRDANGDLLGRAFATGAGAAAHGALLRAVGRFQWTGSDAGLVSREPDLDTLDTRTPGVRRQLDAWACTAVAAGILTLVLPTGAEAWASVGLHTAVASWT
jgi:hypothetical protein